MNHTIIVNWKEKGFGCDKTCTYCNWRFSSELPHGLQRYTLISDFISQCKKTFITISGGAEPLWKFEKYGDELKALLEFIKSHGFHTRIITREVQQIHKLQGLLDYVSISLDNEVLQEVRRVSQRDWKGIDIEYSLVLPPWRSEDIAKLDYTKLQRILGKRLILRENLNSIFKLDFKQLKRQRNIFYVPKKLCINSMYLTNRIVNGKELILERESLFNYLFSHPDIYIFGGLAKHYIDPTQQYKDIDIIVTNKNALIDLTSTFGYSFYNVTSAEFNYPKYYMGSSNKENLPIQAIELDKEDVNRFVFNNQYDIDRIYLHNNNVFVDSTTPRIYLERNIKNKVATLIQNRDMSLYHPTRNLIEMKHKQKLIKKGYTIHEC